MTTTAGAPLTAIRAASSSDARKAAHAILSNSRYRPKPKGSRPLTWLGRQEQKVFSAIGRFFHRVTPANGALRLLLLLFVAIAAAVLIARILLRRKRRVAVSSSPTVIVSFVELDSLADAALARGDFREAVLLRFRGGIARLERGPRPAASRLTNNRIAATIPNSFPAIGGTFDDIRYGGRAAERSAAFAARDEWPKIVREATATAVATDTSILEPTTRKRFRRRK